MKFLFVVLLLSGTIYALSFTVGSFRNASSGGSNLGLDQDRLIAELQRNLESIERIVHSASHSESFEDIKNNVVLADSLIKDSQNLAAEIETSFKSRSAIISNFYKSAKDNIKLITDGINGLLSRRPL